MLGRIFWTSFQAEIDILSGNSNGKKIVWWSTKVCHLDLMIE